MKVLTHLKDFFFEKSTLRKVFSQGQVSSHLKATAAMVQGGQAPHRGGNRPWHQPSDVIFCKHEELLELCCHGAFYPDLRESLGG